jgi:two-component system, OmpR family, sensor histidine kinase TctE
LHAAERQWVDEQRRFLADAAHQLRTPMTVLRTQLQSALQRDGDLRASLAEMIHTVDRATGLANQLLSVSKLEQLKRDGRLEQVALAPAVRDAVVELSPLISRKRLEFSLAGADVRVQGEAMMLGELLRNLLANAIHHSLPGANLGIVLRSGLPWSELVVWDEGEGIDSNVKPRLFTPFSAGKGGVGLGLSICQQLAAAMGASVGLHNRVQDGRVVGVDAVVKWP